MAIHFRGMTLLRHQSENGELVPVDPEHELRNVPLIGLYFSASWCGPCRRFTPMLKQLYENQEVGLGKMLEIVFVSNDYSESSFLSYVREEHGQWLTMAFNPEDNRMLMNDKYHVTGIPALVVIGKQGNTISVDAKNKLAAVGIDGFRNWLFSKVPLVVELDMLIEQWKKDWLREKAQQLEQDFQFRKQLYNCICTNPPEGEVTQDKALMQGQRTSVEQPAAAHTDIIAAKEVNKKTSSKRTSKDATPQQGPPQPPTNTTEDQPSATDHGAEKMVMSNLRVSLITPNNVELEEAETEAASQSSSRTHPPDEPAARG